MRTRVNVDTTLWIAQAVLAFVFFWVGSLRALTPLLDVAAQVPWVRDLPRQLPLHTIGFLEILFALGLLVPAMTRFSSWLTPASAVALAMFATAGATEHVLHSQWLLAGWSMLLVAASLFIAFGRTFVLPIAKRRWSEEDPSGWPGEHEDDDVFSSEIYAP